MVGRPRDGRKAVRYVFLVSIKSDRHKCPVIIGTAIADVKAPNAARSARSLGVVDWYALYMYLLLSAIDW